MNPIIRLFAAAITLNSKYLSSDYGNEGTDEWIAAHPARKRTVTNNCDGTQTVTGANIRTVDLHTQGTTQQGNRSRVASHEGKGVWRVKSQSWAEMTAQGMTPEEYQDYIDKQRGAR
jgi:hypothetical protein